MHFDVRYKVLEELASIGSLRRHIQEIVKQSHDFIIIEPQYIQSIHAHTHTHTKKTVLNDQLISTQHTHMVEIYETTFVKLLCLYLQQFTKS